MAEHTSVSDIEKEAKRLKRDLEGWREVILPINSILLWEKKSYCGFIAGTTTAVFLLLWHNDPSILTTVSFLGLAITIADYLVPTLTSHLYNADSWTSAKERKLESICRNLAANKSSFINKTKCFYHMRKDRPKLYYIIVITNLLFLGWIGNVINNLFLTYLIVTILLLLPGIQHHGILKPYTSKIPDFLSSKTFGKSDDLKKSE